MAKPAGMVPEPITNASPMARRVNLGALVRRSVSNNWRVGLYVILIILCVLFGPEEPLKFIYTEF